MNKIVSGLLVAGIMAVSSAANALTIKSGEVLTSDGQVMPAYATESGQRQLSQNGYIIGGGEIHISISDDHSDVVSIPLNELSGKNKEQIREVIGDAILDKVGAELAVEAELAAEGVAISHNVQDIIDNAGIDQAINQDVINAIGQEVVDEIIASDNFQHNLDALIADGVPADEARKIANESCPGGCGQ